MQIDEGLGTTVCGVGACVVTVDNCINGFPQTCAPGMPGIEGPPGNTNCTNTIDDDCDGLIDLNDLVDCVTSPQTNHFLCYQTKSSRGDICSVNALQNVGGTCQTEEN